MLPASSSARTLVRAALYQSSGCRVREGRQAKYAKSEFLLRSETYLLGKNSEGQSKETMNLTSWASRGDFGSEAFGRNLSNKMRILEEGGAVSSEASADASSPG